MSSFDDQSPNKLSDSTPDWIRLLTQESRHRVHVCFGKNCTPNGAEAVFDGFARAIRETGLAGEIELLATSCRSRCELGPSVNVYPGPITYGEMTPERAETVVKRHLISGGGAVTDYIVTEADVERAKGGR